jgi:hypothetical protein
LARHGEWTKPTSKSKGDGLISIERSISKDSQLASCSASIETSPPPKQFFTQAIKQHGLPEKVIVDGYSATHTAISELKAKNVLPQSTKVMTSKCLNNLIEHDDRTVKQRIYPMLGLKRLGNAAITISGIELIHKIRKGQFDASKISHSGVRVAQLWETVLSM